MRSNKTPGYISEIKEIISNARQGAFSAVKFFMVRAYWLTGRRIVVEEQNGKERADYGKQVINNVSKELSKEFGKGYSVSNIKYFRQFYNTFPDVENSIGHSVSGEFKDSAISDLANSHAVSDQSMFQRWFSLQTQFKTELYQVLFSRLSWTHIRHLLRVADPNAREWYIKEAAANHWATRTLDRNISTQDNPTIGILLCTETDKTIAKYSVLNENKQLFANKYLPYLPSEEALAAEIEREKELIRLQLEAEDEE